MTRNSFFLSGLLAVAAWGGGSLAAEAGAARSAQAAVEAVLNRYHSAAAQADGAAYFALMAPECVLLGTDATERWTVEQFKGYAQPHFSRGKGWTYLVQARHVTFSPTGDFAWFDEILDNKSYGTCRGTGVLRREGDRWLLCQYHLTIPVPNALAKQVAQLIRGPAEPAAAAGK
jgi:ketosteroid isomerase-like protein